MCRFPLAEQIAATLPLSSVMTVCPVTKELYGYSVPVLDRSKAINILCEREIYCNTEAHRVALEILEERISLLN